MTPDEIERLAERIARILREGDWIPGPVRPDPPGSPTPGQLPAWAASAQSLGDVAPGRSRGDGGPGRHRADYGALSAAARAAAAGRGPSPGRVAGGSGSRVTTRGRRVPVAISNRHVHLSQSDAEALFGPGTSLTPDRPIRQPGQYAAHQRVSVVGPDGRIEGVRVVGPTREETQVELARSDCREIGLAAPVAGSGHLRGAAPVTLEGPAGRVDLPAAAIVAARHLHVSEEDAPGLGLADGDRVDLDVGSGERRVRLFGVLVRSGSRHATELHLDRDEAWAVGIDGSGQEAVMVGRPRRGRGMGTGPSRTTGARPLISAQDVDRLAAEGETLSDGSRYLVTPAARDRARALGIWRSR